MHRGLGLNGRHTTLQTSHHPRIPPREDDPDIRRPVDVEAVEPRRRDADDGVALAVNRQRASDDILTTTESGTPPARTDHRDVVIRCIWRPADDRRDAESGEEIRRDLLDFTLGLLGAVNGDCRAILQAHEADDVRKDLSADRIEHIPIEERRHGLSAPGFPVVVVGGEHLQLHEAVWVAYRQGTKQQVVDQAEERGVGADAERERERDDGREDRSLPEHSDGVPRVLHERIDQREPPRVAMPFAERCRQAEFEESVAPRVRFGQPAPTGLIGQQLEVRGQFIVELPIEPVPADERSQARPEQAEEGGHDSAPGSASTRPIMAATRSQFSVSAASCFSPALVMA